MYAKESSGNGVRETFNQRVMGSNPIALTIKIKKTYCFGDHGGQYRRRLRAGLQILKKILRK
jgi:hypothetical protein